MKTLLLHAIKDGRDFYALFPFEANGSLFCWLTKSTIYSSPTFSRVLSEENLSKVNVETLDLRTTDSEELEEIVENCSFEVFEKIMKIAEEKVLKYIATSKLTGEVEFFKKEREEFLEKYKIQDEACKMKALNEAYMKEVKRFMSDEMTTVIKVLASEAEQIKVLMLQNGFTLPEDKEGEI